MEERVLDVEVALEISFEELLTRNRATEALIVEGSAS